MEMEGEIPVAEPEPGLTAEGRHRLEAVERLVAPAPPPVAIEAAGQSVGDRIEIGGDVEPPPLEIVPGVADDGEVRGIDHGGETPDQLGGSGAAGEDDDHGRRGPGLPSRTHTALQPRPRRRPASGFDSATV